MAGFNDRYFGRDTDGGKQAEVDTSKPARAPVAGLKPKDLVGIPWRVAFALQADGWYLRSDIIWSKPNPMPESVTDRPTKSHEYLFILTKSARYYFDADAVRESYALTSNTAEAEMRGDYARGAMGIRSGEKGAARADGAAGGQQMGATAFLNGGYTQGGRNIRSVWNIATRPYPGAHFAVFPPELPERCIKAGSPALGYVLDPFAGSGTVGMVANRLSRRAILIDLNPEYLKQQLKRNAQTPLGLGA
jgi:site-specific DNA-methyltransferase (cytosine-N4-specific)